MVTLVAGAGLFYLAARGVDADELVHTLARTRWQELSLALTLNLASPFLRALRWRMLFEGAVPSFAHLTRSVAVAQTLNFVLPLRTGDLARVFVRGARKLHSAGTLAVEKSIDAVFFAALCLLLPAVWAMPAWLEARRVPVVATAGLYVLAVGILGWALSRLRRVPRIIYIPELRKFPALFLLSSVIWISSLLVNWYVLQALQVRAPLVASAVLLIVLQIGVTVPTTPGKLGVFQYLTVLALSLFGVSRTAGLAVGVLLHLLVFLPTALLAGGFLLLQSGEPAGAAMTVNTKAPSHQGTEA